MKTVKADPLRFSLLVAAYRAEGLIDVKQSLPLFVLGAHGDFDDGGESKPGMERISKIAGVRRVDARNSIDYAEQLGLVRKVAKVKRRGGYAPIWQLTEPVPLPEKVAKRLGVGADMDKYENTVTMLNDTRPTEPDTRPTEPDTRPTEPDTRPDDQASESPEHVANTGDEGQEQRSQWDANPTPQTLSGVVGGVVDAVDSLRSPTATTLENSSVQSWLRDVHYWGGSKTKGIEVSTHGKLLAQAERLRRRWAPVVFVDLGLQDWGSDGKRSAAGFVANRMAQQPDSPPIASIVNEFTLAKIIVGDVLGDTARLRPLDEAEQVAVLSAVLDRLGVVETVSERDLRGDTADVYHTLTRPLRRADVDALRRVALDLEDISACALDQGWRDEF